MFRENKTTGRLGETPESKERSYCIIGQTAVNENKAIFAVLFRRDPEGSAPPPGRGETLYRSFLFSIPCNN